MRLWRASPPLARPQRHTSTLAARRRPTAFTITATGKDNLPGFQLHDQPSCGADLELASGRVAPTHLLDRQEGGHVLNRTTLARGFTLIEILITLSIVGIVLALGAPAFGEWIQNTQIRSAAESMLTGIKLARTEAAKSNCASHFQLTDTGGTPSTAGPYWLVIVRRVRRRRNVTCDPSQPHIIRSRVSVDGTANAVYAASQSSIDFDSLGRVTPSRGRSRRRHHESDRRSLRRLQRTHALSEDHGHSRGSGAHVRPGGDGRQRLKKVLRTT